MSQRIHEEILDLIENSRGELKTQIMKLTNQKNVKLGLKFATINKYYQELLKTYDPKDIIIVGQPLDGNHVTIKAQNYVSDDLKHADENYYSSKPKEVKDRLQGAYYSVTATIMINKKK
jgi:pyrrolidone-carboxylate peptidase